jgi:hypothetical protein
VTAALPVLEKNLRTKSGFLYFTSYWKKRSLSFATNLAPARRYADVLPFQVLKIAHSVAATGRDERLRDRLARPDAADHREEHDGERLVGGSPEAEAEAPG